MINNLRFLPEIRPHLAQIHNQSFDNLPRKACFKIWPFSSKTKGAITIVGSNRTSWNLEKAMGMSCDGGTTPGSHGRATRVACAATAVSWPQPSCPLTKWHHFSLPEQCVSWMEGQSTSSTIGHTLREREREREMESDRERGGTREWGKERESSRGGLKEAEGGGIGFSLEKFAPSAVERYWGKGRTRGELGFLSPRLIGPLCPIKSFYIFF